MASTALGILAASWGIVMALSPILQIRRILHRRSSDDVSVGYLLVVTVGFGIWIAYGTIIGNLVIMLPNIVALLVGATTIVVALRYRATRRNRGSPLHAPTPFRHQEGVVEAGKPRGELLG
ncbi:MAG TPA: SemiSWEET family transporter [Actinomycetota bacterium]|nr:SemiSWEET family transporter [Actinomycetota bacterium]